MNNTNLTLPNVVNNICITSRNPKRQFAILTLIENNTTDVIIVWLIHSTNYTHQLKTTHSVYWELIRFK